MFALMTEQRRTNKPHDSATPVSSDTHRASKERRPGLTLHNVSEPSASRILFHAAVLALALRLIRIYFDAGKTG